MDSATITFFGVEAMQEHLGVSVKTSFLGLTVIYAAFALITPLWWGCTS
jgi:hypothetical protein